jgi:ribosome-associated protein
MPPSNISLSLLFSNAKNHPDMTEPSQSESNPLEISETAAAPEEKHEPTIHLDQFLKTCGVATGGQAKRMIQGGEILVNGEVETRRRKQLRVGDEVDWDGIVYVVAMATDESEEDENADPT